MLTQPTGPGRLYLTHVEGGAVSQYILDLHQRMNQITLFADDHPDCTHFVVWNVLSSEGSGWDFAPCRSLAVALACINGLLIKGIKEETISVVSLA